jgi:hypothetical protein
MGVHSAACFLVSWNAFAGAHGKTEENITPGALFYFRHAGTDTGLSCTWAPRKQGYGTSWTYLA